MPVLGLPPMAALPGDERAALAAEERDDRAHIVGVPTRRAPFGFRSRSSCSADVLEISKVSFCRR